MNKFFCYIAAIFLIKIANAQCNFQVQGTVNELSFHIGIADVKLSIKETNSLTFTDSLGNFVFKNLCAGEYHLLIETHHAEKQQIFIQLKKDTFLHLDILHDADFLNEVHIHATHKPSTEIVNTINSHTIDQNGGENLATQLKYLAGVSVLKTGSNMALPVIQGMFGTRIQTIVNGISIANQNWGVDHSPEIDPLQANHISVLKAGSALQFSGEGLGNVLLVESGAMPKEPHWHGKSAVYFQSNGKKYTAHSLLERRWNKNAVRAQMGASSSGDLHTPRYVMSNTGFTTGSINVDFYRKTEKYYSVIYASYYFAQTGILSSAHLGNITDLRNALRSDTPLIIKEYTRKINNPKQTVSHAVLNWQNKVSWRTNKWININYAVQFNSRKEFDVRRARYATKPVLHMTLFNQQLHIFRELGFLNVSNKYGLHINYENNNNATDLGILPIVPDYIKNQIAAYWIVQGGSKKKSWELAARLSRTNYFAYILNNTKTDYNAKTFNYYNPNISLAYYFLLPNKWKLQLNAGMNSRSPHIYELSAQGLHQGVGAFEIGDLALKSEMAYKLSSNLEGKFGKRFLFQLQPYMQWVSNYIYLQADTGLLLTIRGAFPKFNYKQQGAWMRGTDAIIKAEFADRLVLGLKLGLLQVNGINNGEGIVNTPPSNGMVYMDYIWGKSKNWEKFITVNYTYVSKQTNVASNADFAPVPAAYGLWDMKLGMKGSKMKLGWLEIGVGVNNIANTYYRDYLNRWRYFTAETGRSINFWCLLKW